MIWANHDIFGDEKKREELNSRKVLVNIEYPPKKLARSDSVVALTRNSTQTDKVEFIDATPIRRNVVEKTNIVGNNVPDRLTLPLIHPLDQQKTPLSSPRPLLSSSRRRISIGSDSDQFSEHFEDESLVDDDSLASIDQSEVYEPMNLSISSNGHLNFDFLEHKRDGHAENTGEKESDFTVDNVILGDTIPSTDKDSSSFQLTSTNVQSQKDHMDKLRLEIRRTCLKIAAESYKNANVDVPDFLLAQLNTEWNKSIVQKERNDSKCQPISADHGRNQNPLPDKLVVEDMAPTPLQPADKTLNHPTVLKLSKEDQIHALPCQCAFYNIFPGFGILTPQGLADIDESEFGRHFFSKSLATTKLPKSDAPVKPNNTDVLSADFGTSFTIEQKAQINLEDPVEEERESSLVMDNVDYHEIVLLRNKDHAKTPNEDIYDEESDHTNWTSITIRCKDHDEMDSLIRDLKASARDTAIVPFSPNPKSRLRKRKRMNIRRSTQDIKETKSINSESFISSPNDSNIPPTFNVIDSVQAHSSRISETQSLTSRTEPVYGAKKKSQWNLNFNNYYYCEICHVNFTLLTRRHHCRECERSCCGDCSSVLVVSGGDERRYCNRCSAEILRKQSQALHRQAGLKRRSSFLPDLPGKVHPSCSRLGVSVMGKLPAWKYYLHFDASRRPAVGRITVEVIEALALPTYDMLKGKVDPYVRATITGYDRDMRWTLREWTASNRFSLQSTYCSATLSPVWRGPGRKGGELLTLPVICTAGAVLRLEVLHYNEWTHSRGKDIVLGYVEIPLSDLSNSNLRREYEIVETGSGRKKKIYHDGYCDRWYRLLSVDEASPSVILSKPIADLSTVKPPDERATDRTKESLKEVWKRTVGFFITPVEWLASSIQLDLPARKPEAVCEQHKSNAILHVRIKLNASEFGDVMSHVWWPPVQRFPPVPPFDPQVLWNRLQVVFQVTEPYRDAFKFLEDVIKWKHDPLVCVETFLIIALHILVISHLLPLLHIYLFVFIIIRLKKAHGHSQRLIHENVNLKTTIREDGSKNTPMDRLSKNLDDSVTDDDHFPLSPSAERLNERVHAVEYPHASSNDDEDAAKLNFAVNWVAKRFLDNKGLEAIQFDLGCLARDVKNLTMVWDGTNPFYSKVAMFAISVSFVLHIYFNRRLIWLFGIFSWYFSQSPLTILLARMIFGLWRGLAKATRRREIYDAEIIELVMKAQ